MRRRAAPALAAAALLATAGAATGARVPLSLPSPFQPLSNEPPIGLAGPAVIEVESGASVHTVDAATKVTVSVDRTGSAVAIEATQRLVVYGKGDYAYTVGGPVSDVQPAPGTQSQPGMRRGAILWSGFSAGRRVLAARANLELRRTTEHLPLRVRVEAGRLTLENTTRVSVTAPTGVADAAAVAGYLDRLRAALPDVPPRLSFAGASGVAAHPFDVESPLHVTGTAGGRRVDVVLGGGRPLRASLPVGGGRVRLAVEPELPLALLEPPRHARSWKVAARRLGGEALVRRTVEVLLRLSRMRQYERFLGNPDPNGRSTTSYVYRTGAAPATPAVEPGPQGSEIWRTPLFVALAVAGAAAALVVWARA
jgi:hypothetical protein